MHPGVQGAGAQYLCPDTAVVRRCWDKLLQVGAPIDPKTIRCPHSAPVHTDLAGTGIYT